MSRLRLPRSPGTLPRTMPNGSKAVTRIEDPAAMALKTIVSPREGPVKAVFTFEVIDRRSRRVDDHAREGNHMLTMEDYARQPREQRMQRLTRTADELAAAIKGRSESVLCRRPDAKNWAAKEIVCHLRDAEEAFRARLDQILAMDVDPALIPTDAARLAD